MSSSPEPSFGQTHFGTARLGDRRRTGSLIDLADRFARHPGGSLPDKCADPNALQRCYTLMQARAVTHAAVLGAHVEHTLDLLHDQHGPLLCLHDTTELDYSGHASLAAQLGPIGNGHGRGWLCHSSLFVRPSDRRVLGLGQQLLHVRAAVPPGETAAAKRDRKSRESLLWSAAVEAVQRRWEAAQQPPRRGQPPRPFPADLLVVDVCDRGADIFEFLDKEEVLGRHYVIRAYQDRRVQVGHDADADAQVLAHLRGHVRSLPGHGRRVITVHGRHGQPDRPAVVRVAWAAVQLQPPRKACGRYRGVPLAVWVVRVWEEEPPAGVEAVEWLLLTNVAVTDEASAWERVDWYGCRWLQEEWHKALKTGCAVEEPQFTDVARLEPMVALLSVVALTLLEVRSQSRDEATAGRPATEVIGAEYVEVLSGWRWGERRELTVREFYLALARLGGHQNRRGDGPPGWLVLWRGWTKLQLMVEGARAARRARQRAKPRNEPPDKSLK
jgi:hypothetical protein